jgi:hypothetical protein
MLTMCIEGVAYIAFVVWSIVVVSKKLAAKPTTD